MSATPTVNGGSSALPSQTDYDESGDMNSSHERNLRYAWEKWCEALELYTRLHMSTCEGGAEYYKEKVPNPNLNGFQPLDLESWISERKRVKAEESGSVIKEG